MDGAPKVTFTEQDLSFFIASVTEGRNCMIVTARKGPINSPMLVGSMIQYRDIYGLSLPDTNIDQVVQRALDRGAVLYINRIAHYTDPTDASSLTATKAAFTFKSAGSVDTLTLEASSEGSWGGTLTVKITANAANPNRFDMEIRFPEQPTMSERHTSLTMDEGDDRYAVTYLNSFSKLVVATDEDAGDPFVGDTVTIDGTTITGGEDFPSDPTDIPAMAISMAAAIEAQESDVNASAVSNVVTITAAVAGPGGNSLALSTVSAGSNLVASGSTLSGGAAAIAATGTVTYGAPSNGDTLVVGGTTFTKAPSAGPAAFSTIAELTSLIDALSSVSAVDNGTVITITGTPAGASGNAVTVTKTGSALTLGGAITGGHLGGGVNAIAASGTITIDPTPTIVDNPAPIGPIALQGGADGLSSLDDDDYIGDSAAGTGFHAFNDVDDAFGLAAPDGESPDVCVAGVAYADAREDLVFCFSSPASVRDYLGAIAFRNGTSPYSHSAFNSSYGAMYFGRPKVRSAKTSQVIDISPMGDVFGVHAYSDKKAEVWFAPAGLQRGRIPNTLGVHYNVGTPARETELDELSNNQINSIVDFAQDGTCIWDELTLQTIPSALQSLHIRRLLIYMKKALLKVNKVWLFEPNDPVTWRRVFNMTNPWMADLLSRRAFYDYLIQCDQDAHSIDDAVLNTPERIDRGEFVCRIFIKPTRTLRNFGIEAVITKSSAVFTELLDVRL